MHRTDSALLLAVLGLAAGGCMPTTTDLQRAIHYGDRAWLQEELAKGEKVNETTRGTPLFHAILAHDLDMVKVLVEAGADVNLDSYVQCKGPYAKCMEDEDKEEKKARPLTMAIARGDYAIARYLISQGANTGDDLPLHTMAVSPPEANLAPLVKLVVRTSKGDPFGRSNTGMTALGLAVVTNQTSLIAALLDAGAPVSATSTVTDLGNLLEGASSDEMSPLLLAVAHGWGNAVQILLEHGASRDERSANGETFDTVLAKKSVRDETRSREIAAQMERDRADARAEREANAAMASALINGVSTGVANGIQQSQDERAQAQAQVDAAADSDRRAREWREREAQQRQNDVPDAPSQPAQAQASADPPPASAPVAAPPKAAKKYFLLGIINRKTKGICYDSEIVRSDVTENPAEYTQMVRGRATEVSDRQRQAVHVGGHGAHRRGRGRGHLQRHQARGRVRLRFPLHLVQTRSQLHGRRVHPGAGRHRAPGAAALAVADDGGLTARRPLTASAEMVPRGRVALGAFTHRAEHVGAPLAARLRHHVDSPHHGQLDAPYQRLSVRPRTRGNTSSRWAWARR